MTRPRRLRGWWMLALAMVGLAGVIARARAARDEHGIVPTVEAKRADIEDVVTALGRIQPRDYVDVGAQVSGQLRAILVRPGDVVEKGALLAEIDPRIQHAKLDVDRAQLARLDAELEEQEIDVEFATKQLARQSKLQSEKLTSVEQLEKSARDEKTARAKTNATRARMRELRSTLSADEVALGYTRIYAPISGTIVSVDARQGQTLNANQQAPLILRVADLSTVTVWTQVSEADVVRLHAGMNLYCTALGYGDRRFPAKLRQVMPAPPRPSTAGPSAAPANVVFYTALFDLDNRANELRPEMSMQVFFVTAEAKQAVVVPSSALRGERLADGCLKVEVETRDGRTARRVLRTGIATRFFVEVTSGLEPGERIVTGPPAASASSWLGLF